MWKQIFITPAETKRAWNGTEYRKHAGKTEARFKAAHVRHAYVIAQAIARKKGWAVSGSPVKL